MCARAIDIVTVGGQEVSFTGVELLVSWKNLFSPGSALTDLLCDFERVF